MYNAASRGVSQSLEPSVLAFLCSQEQTRCGMWPRRHYTRTIISTVINKRMNLFFFPSQPVAQVNPQMKTWLREINYKLIMCACVCKIVWACVRTAACAFEGCHSWLPHHCQSEPVQPAWDGWTQEDDLTHILALKTAFTKKEPFISARLISNTASLILTFCCITLDRLHYQPTLVILWISIGIFVAIATESAFHQCMIQNPYVVVWSCCPKIRYT